MLWDWSYCRIWNDSTMGTAKQRPRALNSSRPNPQPFPLGTEGCRRPTGVWTAQKNYQDCTSPSGTDWCIWSYAYHVGSEVYTRKTIFQALERLWSGAMHISLLKEKEFNLILNASSRNTHLVNLRTSTNFALMCYKFTCNERHYNPQLDI